MRGRALAVLAAVALVVVVAVVVVSRVGSAPAADTVATRATGLPLIASSTTGPQSSVILPMGHLDDPVNTFWQLFLRPTGSANWLLRTPPGVATNGGLVAATSGQRPLTAGFLISQNLTFSPLARTVTGGASWSTGQLPDPLAGSPDDLAVAPDGNLLALVARDGQTVLSSPGGLSSWAPVVATGSLARSSRGCPVAAVTAVAFLPTGAPLLGATCGTGDRLGLLSATGPQRSRRWENVGPLLPEGSGPVDGSSVVRLDATAEGDAGLADARAGSSRSLIAFWGGDPPDRWILSPRLPVPSGWTVTATGVGGGGGQAMTVLLGAGADRRLVAVGGPNGSWVTLPTPPPGTGAVATVGAETDAFVVSGSNLTVWVLPSGSTRWTRSARIAVPIPYGSSS